MYELSYFVQVPRSRHQHKALEARVLMSIRTLMEKDFQKATVHKTLWSKISTDLENQGIIASADQCSNKFKAKKKDYKAVKDHNSHSGNDRKTCRFEKEFDDLFGFKAGTRPQYT